MRTQHLRAVSAPPILQVALYARVSSDQQAEHHTIDSITPSTDGMSRLGGPCDQILWRALTGTCSLFAPLGGLL